MTIKLKQLDYLLLNFCMIVEFIIETIVEVSQNSKNNRWFMTPKHFSVCDAIYECRCNL